MGKLGLGVLFIIGLLPGTAHVPAACGTNQVQGGLLPENFQFKVLVPISEPKRARRMAGGLPERQNHK